MAKPLFRGSGVALVTPFTDFGVDFESLAHFVDWQIEHDTDALIACGTTGEASTMSELEKIAVIDAVVQRASGRVPVIAGTGGNNTREAIQLSKKAEAHGADALLVVTPYYNKTSQAGLIAHYTAIADEVNIPIIVYNVPGRTGLNMLPATMAELSKHPNMRGMKEASANIDQITELSRLCGERISIYAGNDEHILPVLSVGGEGVITTVGNIAPREVHELVVRWFRGDVEGARAMQFLINPLVKALFTDVNPMPLKAAFRMIGMSMGKVRLPLVDELSPASVDQLKKALTEFGLK